jgi:hypothetical protein
MELSAKNHGWSGWLQALQSCNDRLGEFLTQGDWEKAQAEVSTRDHLLRESAVMLMRLKKAQQEGSDTGDLQHVKQVLPEVLETGQSFVEALQNRRHELGLKIKAVQQGRAALNMYRTAKPEAPPRFLDRKG